MGAIRRKKATGNLMICDVNICTLLICAQLTDANFYNVCVWAAVASQSMDLTCMD